MAAHRQLRFRFRHQLQLQFLGLPNVFLSIVTWSILIPSWISHLINSIPAVTALAIRFVSVIRSRFFPFRLTRAHSAQSVTFARKIRFRPRGYAITDFWIKHAIPNEIWWYQRHWNVLLHWCWNPHLTHVTWDVTWIDINARSHECLTPTFLMPGSQRGLYKQMWLCQGSDPKVACHFLKVFLSTRDSKSLDIESETLQSRDLQARM